MEHTIEEYKRSFCKVFTSCDGHKYIQSKSTDKYIYLKCAIFRTSCKGTVRINSETNLITPMQDHNHNMIKLKSKWKSMLNHHNQTTWKCLMMRPELILSLAIFPLQNVSHSCTGLEGSFNQRFRLTAVEFCNMLPTTPYGQYFKIQVTCGEQTVVIFFSEKIDHC